MLVFGNIITYNIEISNLVPSKLHVFEILYYLNKISLILFFLATIFVFKRISLLPIFLALNNPTIFSV